MNKQTDMDFRSAHQFSSLHREQLMKSEKCGCFYCLKIFHPEKIVEWVDEVDSNVGQTAICPYCSIDSIVGSASNVPITPEFLKGMNQVWF
ncbi:hypothetical protein [Aliikangiella sp. IMCC44359]|uniref:hypothetical protein n=1 Tax=Aliikangiella sp. IMCC44359 TaxID=3459125 RepID=UPI00403AF0D9